MHESQLSDIDLIQAVTVGDTVAFDRLDERYRNRLTKFLVKQTGDWNQADDLVQQTFLKAFENIRSIRNGEKFVAWLYSIAYRLTIDIQRAVKQNTVTLEQQDHFSVVMKPDQIAIEKETGQQLWSLARQVLPTEEYSVLWLRYVEGLTDKEIATVLEKTHGAVRVILYRARRRLAESDEIEKFL